jgi:hypothetical protein
MEQEFLDGQLGRNIRRQLERDFGNDLLSVAPREEACQARLARCNPIEVLDAFGDTGSMIWHCCMKLILTNTGQMSADVNIIGKWHRLLYVTWQKSGLVGHLRASNSSQMIAKVVRGERMERREPDNV